MTHAANGWLRAVAVVSACLLLCACGSLTPKKLQGTITAFVSACPPVRNVAIDVMSDGALVRSATVRTGATFTFHLSPGHYEVRAGSAATTVVLHPGVRANVDFGSPCVGGGR